MKRNSCRLSIIWVLLSILALNACSTSVVSTSTLSPVPTGEPSSTPTPTLTATPEINLAISDIDLPEGIKLEFWHPWSGEMAETITEITDEFNRTNQWGIQVTIEVHSDDLVLLDDIETANESGALPDIVSAPGAFLRKWQQENLPIQDLNEYVSSPTLGFDQESVNAFLPIFWKSDLSGETRLGIPAFRSGHFLFYNQSWAADLGFDAYPQTSQDFATQMCAAATANASDATLDNNGTGGWVYSTQALAMLSWLRSFSGDSLQAEDGALEINRSANQTALEYLYDLYTDDCAWYGKQSNPYQYFAKRYALAYSGSSQDIFTQEIFDNDNDNQDNWMLIPYPSDENRPVIYVEGYSYALFHGTEEHNTAAWLFLRYLTSTENQIKIIEATGSLPLSSTTINELKEFRSDHPVWDQSLQYLALAQSTPNIVNWVVIEPVFSDMAWQLRISASKDAIPGILTEAQKLIAEADNNQSDEK